MTGARAGTGAARHAPHEVRLYSSAADQKYVQVIGAVRSTMEQKTRFGTEADQRRTLAAYLRRFMTLPAERRGSALQPLSFRNAMAGFSCFGADVELAFDRLKEADASHRDPDPEFPEFPDADGPNVAVVPVVALLEAAYPGQDVSAIRSPTPGAGFGFGIGAAAEVAPPPVPPKLDARLQSLTAAIRSKLEVTTRFGDERQQRRALGKLLDGACASSGGGAIAREQFRGAVAALNCWEADAFALFDAINTGGAPRVPCGAVVDCVFQGAR